MLLSEDVDPRSQTGILSFNSKPRVNSVDSASSKRGYVNIPACTETCTRGFSTEGLQGNTCTKADF